jgi:catechol 2,3-dioxygenase-like lactoylglutathione lyase family enzyme
MNDDFTVAGADFKALQHRNAAPTNPIGISGCDHVGVPARDPILAGAFVVQILGGVEFIKAGYSEEDIRLGRPKHIFFHIGSLVYEVAQQSDESGYSPIKTRNDQPHFAFGTTAEGLLKFAAHLRANNIPFDGPRSHRGMSACSVYFRDPDHNNLEVTTWEKVPEGVTRPMGGPHGFPVWEKLAHSWRPKG